MAKNIFKIEKVSLTLLQFMKHVDGYVMALRLNLPNIQGPF